MNQIKDSDPPSYDSAKEDLAQIKLEPPQATSAVKYSADPEVSSFGKQVKIS